MVYAIRAVTETFNVFIGGIAAATLSFDLGATCIWFAAPTSSRLDLVLGCFELVPQVTVR